MDTDHYLVLRDAADREDILEALEQGCAKPLGEDQRARALVDIDAVLDAHRQALKAGLDQWVTKPSRERAAGALEDLAKHLDAAAEQMERLPPLARVALRLDGFDPRSPLGQLLVNEQEAVGLQAGTRKSAMRIYLDHFREMVGLVDSKRGMMKVIAMDNRSAAERGEHPQITWNGSADGGFAPPIESFLVAVRRYGAMARIKANDLREHRRGPGRVAAGTERVLTLNLAEIWRTNTGKEPTTDHNTGDSRFLRFARAAARQVDASYHGRASLEEILSLRAGNAQKGAKIS